MRPQPDSPTFQADFVPFGTSQGQNDANEIAAMAYYLGSSCSAAKPTNDGPTEARAIMAWFGFAPTGTMVVISPDGLTVPGWALVSREQMALAIANPNGYQHHLNAVVRGVSWSGAKQLYR